VSHKRFITTLTEAFKALGGEAWASRPKSAKEKSDEQDIDEVIFANKFTALTLDGQDDGEQIDETTQTPADDLLDTASVQRPTQKSKNKGGKRKRGKKSKTRTKSTPEESSLDEVPLESYRIIEDDSGLVTDYLMAVYSIVTEWTELRHYVQGLWYDVAFRDLNSAVAGALSNIAIAMIKQTESMIFVDFPGHDSYETVMKTITRGDPETAQGMFHMALHRIDPRTGFIRIYLTLSWIFKRLAVVNQPSPC